MREDLPVDMPSELLQSLDSLTDGYICMGD